MFCDKKEMDAIERVHYRTLKVVYNNYNLSYADLLAIDGKLSIHQKHLHYLAVEIYKSVNNLNPEFMWCFFKGRNHQYKLRSGPSLVIPQVNSSQIWN